MRTSIQEDEAVASTSKSPEYRNVFTTVMQEPDMVWCLQLHDKLRRMEHNRRTDFKDYMDYIAYKSIKGDWPSEPSEM